MNQPDAVLIDDDAGFRLFWKEDAESVGKTLRMFSTPEAFMAHIGEFKKDTPIYVDCDLGEGKVRGDELAKELHAKGFTNIYLCTGYGPEDFPPMPWIKEIRGKASPWDPQPINGASKESGRSTPPGETPMNDAELADLCDAMHRLEMRLEYTADQDLYRNHAREEEKTLLAKVNTDVKAVSARISVYVRQRLKELGPTPVKPAKRKAPASVGQLRHDMVGLSSQLEYSAEQNLFRGRKPSPPPDVITEGTLIIELDQKMQALTENLGEYLQERLKEISPA